MVQTLNLPLDVMAAVPVRGDGQGQPLKLFAEHIIQDAPVPAGEEG